LKDKREWIMDILADPNSINDEPVENTSKGESTGGSGWNGMTIKDILEKVDLFNFAMISHEEDKKEKEANSITNMSDEKDIMKRKPIKAEPPSAFLGPNLWKKPITLNQLTEGGDEDYENNGNTVDGAGAEFSVMNINDFLQENNFDLVNGSPPSDIFDVESRGHHGFNISTLRRGDFRSRHNSNLSEHSDYSLMETDQMSVGSQDQSAARWNKQKNELPKGENNFLYKESKRAKLEREKEERRRREEARIEFSAEELALATVPGADFDPTLRQFSLDELRPQPIIRKRKKVYVDGNRKDEKYWEKRNKNNVAARRSREARRLKENQISLRTAFLEQENASLNAAVQEAKSEYQKSKMEKEMLMEKLKRYESMSKFLQN